MYKFICPLLIFMGGFVSAINLTMLIETNETYEAAWWKVLISVAIAIVASIYYNLRIKDFS